MISRNVLAARSIFRRVGLLIATIVLLALAPVLQAAENALTFGVFPRRNSTETQKAFTPVADYLGKRLGRSVKLVTSKDFDSFWKAVLEQRFDIVYYNQYHYIRSARDYRVVGHIEESGSSTIAGVIYVRKDSGITDLTQLRGRTIIFGGGEDAMISYIATTYMLQHAGLQKTDYKSVFAINPPNALVALIRQQADAAGGGNSIPDMPEVMSAINGVAFSSLAVSPPLLQLPIAVKRDMPTELRNSIQTLLLDLKNSDQGWQILKTAGLTGVGKAEDKDYDPHRKMVSEVFGAAGSENKQFTRGAQPPASKK
ncbi:MAG: hypothetical protein JWN94_4409 [Betaproteobacteria bacterium]|nr:hypothetical protein [Betaproteobacteria bacterium]